MFRRVLMYLKYNIIILKYEMNALNSLFNASRLYEQVLQEINENIEIKPD